MRRLILHMGMAKAGSTAIQSALLAHEDALREIDILNPTTGRRRGAHWGLLEEIRDQTEPILFPQLSDESRDYPVTIISCEAFWLLSDEGIRRFVEATSEWDVRVILYLRQPGGFLGSSYRQHIKSGKVAGPPEDFITSVKPRLAYDHLVRRWSDTFPLTLRVYDRHRFQIEADFLEQIGAGHLKPSRSIANGTPSDGATRLMLTSNKYIAKRARRRRVNKKLVELERYFAWMDPIDNAVFQRAGRSAVERWDLDVLRNHLSSEDLDALLSA